MCRSRSVRAELPDVVQAFALTFAPAGTVSVTAVPTRARPRLLAFVTVNVMLPAVELPLSSTWLHFGLTAVVVVVVVVVVAGFVGFGPFARASDAAKPATSRTTSRALIFIQRPPS